VEEDLETIMEDLEGLEDLVVMEILAIITFFE
jgi:hypothetical protein